MEEGFQPGSGMPRLEWARCGGKTAISGPIVTGQSNDVDHLHAAVTGEPMRAGKHYVEFTCAPENAQTERDWHAFVGVATGDLQPGQDGAASCYYQKHLWAVCGDNGSLLHGGEWTDWKGKRREFKAGEVVGLMLDCDEGTLTVYANGDSLGLAVRPGMVNVFGDAVAELRGKALYWAAIPVGNRKVEIESKDWPSPRR